VQVLHEAHPVFGPVVKLIGSDRSSATVALHGGHLISWIPPDGVERLFLSSLATVTGAIRGGVPICFPQFNELGSLPKHGFARTSTWRHKDGGRFVLDVAPVTFAGWPFPCALMIEVTLGPATLSIAMSVDNVGHESFSFTGALHTYLRVEDVELVSVDGLGKSVVFDGEVDLALVAVTGAASVRSEGVEVFVCAQTGFADSVIWNIGPQKAAALTDLGPGEWQHYVCVEAAVVASPIFVAPGSRWTGTQTVVARQVARSVAGAI
jgi:glucose-6-phosphate 1-epimerase